MNGTGEGQKEEKKKKIFLHHQAVFGEMYDTMYDTNERGGGGGKTDKGGHV